MAYSMVEPRQLKRIRTQLGVTQAKLANEAGVSRSLIAKIETDKVDPTFTSMKSITEALRLRKSAKVKERFDVLHGMIRASADMEDVQYYLGEGKEAVASSHGSARDLARKLFKKLSKDAESIIDKLRIEQTDNQVGPITPKGGLGVGRKVTKTPVGSPFKKPKLRGII